MPSANRRLTLRMQPTPAQALELDRLRWMHQQLYNAALEARIGAYKKGVSISFYDQAKELTQLRAEDSDFRAMTQRTQNMTLRRLDRAFQAFFRRVKAGQTPGFPRFQSIQRFSGWSSSRGDGYRYTPKKTPEGRWFNGRLTLKGVGAIRCQGKARNVGGEIKQIDITKRAGRWFVSFAVAYEDVDRKGGTRAAGLDWGVNDYATLALADGTTMSVANDRLFQAQQLATAQRQRKASKSLRGKRSNRAKAKHMQIARAHAKLANQRKDRAHKLSAKLVAEYALIVTEKLQIANMTRSAKGTTEKPGKKVAQKAGLNREILDTAPGMLISYIKYKAEEAGTILEVINTRKAKPSQTCPKCWAQAKKTLAERVHVCSCGCAMSRDGAAALVMLLSSKTYTGQKLTPGLPPKTPPKAASAV